MRFKKNAFINVNEQQKLKSTKKLMENFVMNDNINIFKKFKMSLQNNLFIPTVFDKLSIKNMFEFEQFSRQI